MATTGVYVLLTVTDTDPILPSMFALPTRPHMQKVITVGEESLKVVENINPRKVVRCIKSSILVDMVSDDPLPPPGQMWFLLTPYKKDRVIAFNFTYSKGIYYATSSQNKEYTFRSLKEGSVLRWKSFLTEAPALLRIWDSIPKTLTSGKTYKTLAPCMVVCLKEQDELFRKLLFGTDTLQEPDLRAMLKQKKEQLRVLQEQVDALERQLGFLDSSSD